MIRRAACSAWRDLARFFEGVEMRDWLDVFLAALTVAALMALAGGLVAAIVWLVS